MAGARELIVAAAERLFAERGIAAVSLREVGAAAGQRNNSAVQYHVGSREQLVDAVYERRMVPINEQRAEMLASVADGDVRGLVEALVLPLAAADPAYLRFLARALAEDALEVFGAPRPYTTGLREVMERLSAALDLPEGVRSRRIEVAGSLVVHALAERTRTSISDAEVVDLVAGMLTAPVTERSTTWP